MPTAAHCASSCGWPNARAGDTVSLPVTLEAAMEQLTVTACASMLISPGALPLEGMKRDGDAKSVSAWLDEVRCRLSGSQGVEKGIDPLGRMGAGGGDSRCRGDPKDRRKQLILAGFVTDVCVAFVARWNARREPTNQMDLDANRRHVTRSSRGQLDLDRRYIRWPDLLLHARTLCHGEPNRSGTRLFSSRASS